MLGAMIENLRKELTGSKKIQHQRIAKNPVRVEYIFD